MTRIFPRQFGSIALALTLGALASVLLVSAQEPSAVPKTAAQQFKNIQVLKEIPADQLIPTMQFVAGALGVDCEFCHVEHAMDKDDKKEKQTARKMMAMEFAINKGHFNNEIEVSCYTCHRGSPHPVGIPILAAETATMSAHEHHYDEVQGKTSLPSSDQILDKYLAAVGGADVLYKIKTRVQKGTIDAMGEQYPIEVYSEGPERRVSVSHPSFGDSITAYNGQAGWLSTARGMHPMNTQETAAARVDAQLYFPARLRELFHEFQVHPGEPIGGHE